jgi:uncharacterized protein
MQLRDPAHQVSSKARVLWTIGGLGTVLFLVLVGVAAELWVEWVEIPVWAWAVFGAVALGYLVVMPTLRYRTHRWETTERAVYTQTGWLGRERRIAPMSRVQTVDFEQGAIARALGLATVTVTTASAAGPLRIAALDKDVADRIVAELTTRADLETGDGT